MTSRILPVSEWGRLPVDLDVITRGMRPETCRVLVVEDEGAIVGRWLLFPVLHAECVWIAPSHRRGGSVARRLLRLMRQTARSLGFDRVWTGSDSEAVTQLLTHPSLHAVPVPALSFVMPVGEGACQQQ